MENEKIYSIKINGLDVSISQVEALNNQLNNLEQRIDALSQKAINVTADASVTSSGGGGRRTAELSEEAKLQKDIAATLEKAAQARSEEYKALLSAKAELKEYQTIAKAQQAQENLLTNSNDLKTMAGMKAELRDIKQAMQIMDVDSDGFKLLTQQAAELTEKLKQLESQYGTFGRNVGNYQSAFDAEQFKQLKIEVNGVVREFSSAREALRTLTNERNTLKLMGEDVGDLDKVVKTLQSDINDMGKSSAGMDMLLDTMEGIVAIASTAKGISSLFGFDEKAVDKTIQQLLALQNALQGIETIRKQMQTSEGVGGWLSKGNDAIDKFTKNLFNVKTAATQAAAAEKLQATATSGVSAANVTAAATTRTLATNTDTLTASQKAATVAAKALGLALKAIGIGLIVAGISQLMSIYDEWSEDNKKLKASNEDLQKSLTSVTQATVEGEAKIKIWQERLSQFNGTQDQAKKLTESFNKELGNEFGKVKNLAEAQKRLNEAGEAYIKVLQAQAKAEVFKQLYIKQSMAAIEAGNASLDSYENFFERLNSKIGLGFIGVGIKAASNYFQGTLEERRKNATDAAKKDADSYWNEYIKASEEAEKTAQDAGLFDYSNNDNGNKATKAQIDELKRLNELRISLMKEGWAKIQAQIKEEERQQILEIRNSGRATAKEEEELVRQLYEEKLGKARDEFVKTSQEAFNNMWAGIIQSSRDGLEEQVELLRQAREEAEKAFAENPTVLNNKSQAIQGNPTYGTATKAYTQQTRRDLEMVEDFNISPELRKATEEYISLQRQLLSLQQHLLAAETERKSAEEKLAKANGVEKEEIEAKIKALKEEEKAYNDFALDAEMRLDDFFKNNRRFAKEGETLQDVFDGVAMKLAEFGDNGDITDVFISRLSYIRAYYAKLSALSSKYIDEEKEKQKELLDATYQADRTQENQQWKQWEEEQQKALEQGLITQEEYDTATQEMAEKHWQRLLNLQAKHKADSEKIDADAEREKKQTRADAYNAEIEEFNNFSEAIRQLSNASPTYTSVGGFQFINLKESKKQDIKIITYYEELFRQIQAKKDELNYENRQGIIDREVYDKTLEGLEKAQEGIGQNIDDVKEKMKGYGKELASQINEVVQLLGQSASSILQSISEIQQNALQNEIDALDKEIDKYKELLDKQEEITRQHADKMNSIEDELSTARGDRREELIDEINAEMLARRQSLEEEKRIKEQEAKLEEEKKKIEEELAMERWKDSMRQAAMNAALAISNAAVNTWPMPAAAMMAAAAAVGAAQLAAVKSAKPQKYAEGGVIEGNAHSKGGVKVLGGRAEVEGGEYITNKRTTKQNIQLLDYINSSKRKLTLEDFIDFYGSPKAKRHIVSIGSKFANGGQLPTVSENASLGNRMFEAFEDYSNRPVIVSVVDIASKTNEVNNVRAVAGLPKL